MANPKVEIDVSLNDKATASLKNLSAELKKFGRDVGTISRELTIASGIITTGMTVAFTKAQKDIPAVSNAFKSLNNSVQVMADSVATAALPTLNEFANFANNVALAVKKFSQENAGLIQTVIKGAAATLAFAAALNTLKLAVAATAAIIGLITNPITRILLLLGAITLAVPPLRSAIFSFLAAAKNKFDEFWGNFNQQAKRATNNFDQFAQGFKRSLKSLQDNIADFGDSVSQSFQKAFSDTLFDAITGKLHGLRSVVKALGEEILRSFLKIGTNAVFNKLFGDKENGGLNLLGSFGSLFGGNKAQEAEAKKRVRDVSNQFLDLSFNMKKFARAKDQAIDALKRGAASPAGKTAMAGPIGGIGQLVSDQAMEGIAALNEAMGQTVGMTQAISGGFEAIGGKIVDMAKTYVISQGVMVTASAVAAAITVAISTAAASAIATAWVIPAILASIATLGGAAAIGTAAVAAAVGSAPGITAMGSSVSAGGELPSNASFTDVSPKTKLASGGIVTRPTIAMIGEAGPEAVVPLKKGGMGGRNVEIYINEAKLNSPSNMREFVNLLKEELVR